MQWWLGGVALLGLSACGPNLPEGWENAERVALTQSAGKELGPETETMSLEVMPKSKAVEIKLTNALFRCENQKLEGFVRRGQGTIDLLIQPEEMDPFSVAKCSSVYDVSVTLSSPAGEQHVAVYTRPDTYGGEQEPTLRGTKHGTVPP